MWRCVDANTEYWILCITNKLYHLIALISLFIHIMHAQTRIRIRTQVHSYGFYLICVTHNSSLNLSEVRIKHASKTDYHFRNWINPFSYGGIANHFLDYLTDVITLVCYITIFVLKFLDPHYILTPLIFFYCIHLNLKFIIRIYWKNIGF